MRNLFLLLVLVNLGFLAVVSWVVPRPPPAQRYDGPGITLLREVDPEAKPPLSTQSTADSPDDAAAGPTAAEADTSVPEQRAPRAAAPTTAAGARAKRCIAIGPFSESADAEAAMAKLADAGFEPRQSVTEEEVWDGYWVYIEQIENAELAQEMLTKLGESGIADAYILPKSDKGILISLGVYTDVSRAAKQAERVGRLGYKATVADRERTAQMHWLELTLSGEESAALDLLQAPGRISRLEERACGPSSGAD